MKALFFRILIFFSFCNDKIICQYGVRIFILLTLSIKKNDVFYGVSSQDYYCPLLLLL